MWLTKLREFSTQYLLFATTETKIFEILLEYVNSVSISSAYLSDFPLVFQLVPITRLLARAIAISCPTARNPFL